MIMIGLLMFKFDGTITLGDLSVILTFIISVFGVYNRLSIQISEIKSDLAMIKRWWENCTEGNCPMVKEIREQGKEQRLVRHYREEAEDQA